MGTNLHTLKGPQGSSRPRKRIGRGPGSGTGEQAGRGVKGQKARTGHHGARLGFEGGQVPLQRRLPKKGFKSPFRQQKAVVNVDDITGTGDVDLREMKARGLVPRSARAVKVLGRGLVQGAAVVRASAFSRAAREKIAQAGGRAEEAGE